MSPKKSNGPECFTVFPTAWGPMGAVTGPAGLRRVVLPHYQADDLTALLAWEHQEATRDDEQFADFIEESRRYFNGVPANFNAIALDLPGETAFAGKVYRACRAIPHGQTRSYLDLAKSIGQPDAARAVATMMSKNPLPLVIPCHRVIYSDGRAGGFSAEGGEALKQRLLNFEQR